MNKKWKAAIMALIVLTLLTGVFLFFVLTKVGAFFDETYLPIKYASAML
jgi:polyisoprenyl-teichoic acid--peptidoglycan teichoic acid transferase